MFHNVKKSALSRVQLGREARLAGRMEGAARKQRHQQARSEAVSARLRFARFEASPGGGAARECSRSS